MSLFQKPDNPTWYLYIVHNGERIRSSTGTTDKKEAQRIHDEFKAKLWKETARPSGKTWNDACVAWIKAAPRSQSDRYSIQALGFADRPLSKITAEALEAAIGDKASPTFNRIATIINAILCMADGKGWAEKLPRIAKRSVKTTDFRFLSKEEWDALLIQLPEHLKAPARLSISTGLRQANTIGLQWNKVDLRRRVAWVKAEDAKGDKPIGIPLSDDAVAVLREQVGKSDVWVFPYKGKGRAAGKPIKDIKNAFQNACHRAGVGVVKTWKGADGKMHRKYDGFRWHDFRHTFASWHIMSGTPIEVLQKLGGWSDLRMVMKYAHLAPEHVAQFANNAKPWSSKDALNIA